MIICKTNATPTFKLKYQNILNFVQTVFLLNLNHIRTESVASFVYMRNRIQSYQFVI
jgi:hypothetical protein